VIRTRGIAVALEKLPFNWPPSVAGNAPLFPLSSNLIAALKPVISTEMTFPFPL